jgi:hypothetical protein
MQVLEAWIKNEKEIDSNKVVSSIQTYQTHLGLIEGIKRQRLVIRESGQLGFDVREMMGVPGEDRGLCSRCH